MAYYRLYYHLVWATWDRQALINEERKRVIERAVYRRAGDLKIDVHQVSAMSDHIHIVASIPPHLPVAECVQQLKGSSSYGINVASHQSRFRWQHGYGASTISSDSLAGVVAYVRNQRQHHTAGSLIASLERCEPTLLSVFVRSVSLAKL